MYRNTWCFWLQYNLLILRRKFHLFPWGLPDQSHQHHLIWWQTKTLLRTRHFTYRQLYLSNKYMSTFLLSREMESCMLNHGQQDNGTIIQKGIKGGLPPWTSVAHNNCAPIPIAFYRRDLRSIQMKLKRWGKAGQIQGQGCDFHLWKVPQSETGTGSNKSTTQTGYWLLLPVILQAGGEIHRLQWDLLPAQGHSSLAAV